MKKIGAIICAAMALGAVYEATQGYPLLYYVAGLIAVLGVVLFIERNR